MPTDHLPVVRTKTPAWNKGRIIGQKRPLLPKHVWAIRVRLEIAENIRDLALFNMAIDCKLRGCDLVRLKVRDVFESGHMKERASIMQSNPTSLAARGLVSAERFDQRHNSRAAAADGPSW